MKKVILSKRSKSCSEDLRFGIARPNEQGQGERTQGDSPDRYREESYIEQKIIDLL